MRQNRRTMQLSKTPTQHRSVIPLILLGLGLALIAASGYIILQDIPSQTDFSTVPVETNSEQNLDQTALRNAVMRRSFLPSDSKKQETLQNRKDGVKSIREISEMTTRI